MSNSIEVSERKIEKVFGSLGEKIKVIADIQDYILGEFVDIKSIIFYFLILVLSTILTSFERTFSSRLYLYIISVISFIIERHLFGTNDIEKSFIQIQYFTLICGSNFRSEFLKCEFKSKALFRTFLIILLTLVYTVKAIRHIDYQKENHNLLNKVDTKLTSLCFTPSWAHKYFNNLIKTPFIKKLNSVIRKQNKENF